ncbi:MAG: hypothetical protein ACI4MH_03175 [Candidatus Coproplasma sp.]
MKLKNVLFKAVAVATAIMASSAVFTGCGEHQHTVSKWTTVKEETCLAEGQRQGTCTDCGDVVIETVPADPSKHVYGDWEVTAPTETTEGKAVKTCTLNPSHDKLEVTLPVLSYQEYVQSVQTPAKPLDEGEMLYTLAHEEGDITFTQPIAARGIVTVADAVEVVQSFTSDIRKTEGTISVSSYNFIDGYGSSASSEFYYEFGDDEYTHIYDGSDGIERWCAIENGEFWCAKIDKGGSLVYDTELGNEQYMNGHRFVLTHSSALGAYYGAESFLAGLYAAAETDANADTVINKPKTVDGVTTYSFSFGFVQESNSANEAGYFDGLFCKIKVSFTLKDTYQLDTFKVEAFDLQNVKEGPYATQSWAYDNNGHAYVLPSVDEEKATHVIEKIEFSQTTKAEAAALGWEVPVNEHTKNENLATSFKLYSGVNEITEDFVIENKDVGTAVTLTIRDITPSTADLSSFDKPTFWLVTEKGEVEIDYSTMSMYKVNALYVDGSIKTIRISSRLGGEVTILIKTAMVTKTVKFNFNYAAPTALNASVYEYYQGNYSWSQKDTAQIYTGQTLTFMATVPTGEESSADSTFNVSVTSSNAANATIGDTDNSDVKTFKADKAGEYVVTIVSRLDSSVTCTIKVTVVDAPEMNDILSGTYTGSVVYPNRGEVTVTFSSATEVVVSRFGESETLSVRVVDGNIVTSHKGGANIGASLILNDAYDLILINPTGFEEYNENVFLQKAQ